MESESKKVLRKKFLDLLRSQKEEDRLNKSKAILKKLFSMPEFNDAKRIFFYASFDGEVETHEMMKKSMDAGKEIALPSIKEDQSGMSPILIKDLENDLCEGPYGIKCPNSSKTLIVSPSDLDLIIVPGVAFDRENNRLGRGKGYYDRFLSSLPSSIPTFGLAFDFQIIEHLPHQEEHDIRVSRIICN